MPNTIKSALLTSAAAILVTAANAADFNIPGGDLKAALDSYSRQTGVSLLYSDQAIKGARSHGVQGDIAPDEALSRILNGTGFQIRRHEGSAITIVRRDTQAAEEIGNLQIAQASPAPRAAVETVTVTSSKLGGADVQSIPIAITALSQEQLTATQTAGGPDLVRQVPNLTFTKTNFSGYSIQIRGIGTQAISVTTDPAVAVALNDIPFIRNHFFEQEFFDLSQAEVLRGPQGTLYGRNATAGVVNLVTAKPTDQFEAMASADIGNYKNRRFEAMLNLPIVDDRLDVRFAGEWTKRDGYTLNTLTGNQVDGRDLWSGRMSIAWKPRENLQAHLVWEHFYENDDRMRTAKQLCKTDPGRTSVNGIPLPTPESTGGGIGFAFTISQATLSQGCLPTSLYSPDAFGVPNGYALPYVIAGNVAGALLGSINVYANTTQSRDLREIETQIDPIYKAKNDTVELNVDYKVVPSLTFTSQTGFNQDFLWSTEDYNRFNTTPYVFQQADLNDGLKSHSLVVPDGHYRCGYTLVVFNETCPGGYYGTPMGNFCDPQLGCSNRLVAQDLSSEHAWQFSQEFRLASEFAGPLNFSVGGNYMHYETVENYYVFANTLTLFTARAASIRTTEWVPGVTDNLDCLSSAVGSFASPGRQWLDPDAGLSAPTEVCHYIDPNSLENLNDKGHNYFLSKNPYTLNSYAGFGEAYYNITDDVKLTGGLRWTEDSKHFTLIPSELLAQGYGYPSTGTVDQDWKKFTGRAVVNWTPKLDFTDQSLIYASYARGYKAGGANPPGARLGDYNGLAGGYGIPVHPLTFEPEYVHAFEGGTKNTLLDGAVTVNGNVFYYDYKGYQISEIVDRTSINLNFDATVKGAELEATYEPLPGLRFRFAGGYEHTRLADGSNSVDLMDRTAGHPGWVVFRPFVTQASNCIFPEYVVAAAVEGYYQNSEGNQGVSICGFAYNAHLDPLTLLPYKENPTAVNPSQSAILGNITGGYAGYDPVSVDPDAPADVNNGLGLPPNNGEGFSKDLSGNELPNAPKFTTSFSAEYSMPLTEEWAGTLHGDFYWQADSWARVFNDDPYDHIRGYTNVNMALVLTSQTGWQVMGYVKNVFDTTAITGTFLNSDDSGLTTNIFLTDPRLFGVRVTKNW
jgi:outer membrane receptor protein involved in Fe transport